MRFVSVAVFAVFGVFVDGCSCDDQLYSIEEPVEEPDAPPVTPGVGAVAGCVCDESVGAWVGGGQVFVITPAGSVVTTGTDSAGCFVLEGVPVGPQTLNIELLPFHREVPVVVVESQRTQIASPATCAPPAVGDVGAVEGRVCAPDGVTWLAAADVYVELAGGGRVQTDTDGDGRYHLPNVPVGAQTLHIEKGSFSATHAVDVVANETTFLAEDACALDATVSVAIVSGNNDDVAVILDTIGIDDASITTYRGHQGFGVDSTAWGEELLGDYATLAQYDIVFINCGANGIDSYPLLGLRSDVVDNPTYVDNLRQFVAEGGSVYASDEAYDLVERAWPDFVDFYGDDVALDAAQIGVQQIAAVPVDIVDPGLAASMGADQFDIHFNYTLWAIIADVAVGTDIYTRGDTPTSEGTMANMPLTIGFTAGQGRVIYTSFHQEPGVDSATARLLQLLIFEL